MLKKFNILLCSLLLTTSLVGCKLNTSNDELNNKNASFDETYNLLDEKIQGQNGEWPVLAISEPKEINAKEIAESFIQYYDNEIDYAIIYICEQNKDITNTTEMHKDSKYTLDIFNESGVYTYELSNTDPYRSIEKGNLDI
ncbi:MAG: hypothetical protein ACRCVJ_19040 [Clostridium sp.]|uniref:hypothetical protein n=1 Tax=Clostridium sp. TaxID=1506 RepID=UPI003F3CFFA1